MQMSSPSRQTGPLLHCLLFPFSTLLGNTSKCLNAYNGPTNECLCSCLFIENQFVLSYEADVFCMKGGFWQWWINTDTHVCYLTRHSRSLAGREIMMRSFFTNSVTKATSELSERSKAWGRETNRQTERQKERLTFTTFIKATWHSKIHNITLILRHSSESF